MKKLIPFTLLSLYVISPLAVAREQKTLVYVNQNFGFNVPGYKYEQTELPCDIDKNLVELLIKDSTKTGLTMEPVNTAEKVHNGTIPVLVIDIEQLALGKEYSFGTKTTDKLPKVQVTAGILLGQELKTAKHTCAIATLNELTPSSDILDLGVNLSVCDATQKCLRDLSKDIIEWAAPLVIPVNIDK